MPIQRGDSLAKPLPGTCDTAYSFPWAQIRNSWADKTSLASSRPRSSLLCIFLRQNLGLTTSQAIFPSLSRPGQLGEEVLFAGGVEDCLGAACPAGPSPEGAGVGGATPNFAASAARAA